MNDDDKKSPGTSGLMPVKGASCGIRPDADAMEDSEGFDFSAAEALKPEEEAETSAQKPSVRKASDTSLPPASSD